MSTYAPLTDRQLQILRAIADAQPVKVDDATWAVKADLAVQAEDGDIDLTQRGREVLQAHAPR